MNNLSRFCLAVSTIACAAMPITLHSQSSPSFEFFQTSPNTVGGSASGDFNGDGKLDVLSYTTLALGNGDGTFKPPTSIGPTKGGLLNDIAVGDVNRDGKLDVVGVEQGQNLASNYVDIFYGNGDGTFQPVISFKTAYYPRSVAVGNFFGSGRLDVAVGELSGAVEIFRNTGNGFILNNSLQITSAPDSVEFVRAGDIDANGTVDLAVATNTSAYVLWGDGQGNFSPVLLGSPNPPQGGVNLTVGDLNQDGNQDVIVWFDCGMPPPAGHSSGQICTDVEVYYGQGNRTTFHRQALIDTNNDTSNFSPVDVNGDGIGDLVGFVYANSSNQTGMAVYLGHPDGSFDQTPTTVLLGAAGYVPGDFNRDGKIDFAGIGEVALNATPTAPCATSQINPTVTVCAPVNNAYLTSPFRVQATTDDKTNVTALQAYLDGKLVYNQPVTTFNITLSAGLGSHFLVTKAFDASGVSFRSNRTVNIFSGTPGLTCPANLNTANMCLPNATNYTSPVHVLANATPSAIPTAVQLYVDNQLVINVQNQSTALDTWVNLSPGSHYLVFKVFDASGTAYTAAKSITVH
jgi:FG-GAP-like repeat/Bacterial Ig domain